MAFLITTASSGGFLAGYMLEMMLYAISFFCILFVCFWLCWVFRCCMLIFLWLRQVRAPLLLQCAGFSLQWLLLLQSMSCRVWAQYVWPTGLVAPCGMWNLLDQESNPCPLHWQADSSALDQQEGPTNFSVSFSPTFT